MGNAAAPHGGLVIAGNIRRECDAKPDDEAQRVAQIVEQAGIPHATLDPQTGSAMSHQSTACPHKKRLTDKALYRAA